MYKFLLFIVPFVFFSCSQEKKEKSDEILFHYMMNNYKGERTSLDTVTIEKILRHNDDDKLMKEFTFITHQNAHTIRLFCTGNPAPDSGELMFELDSLGIIYSCNNFSVSNIRLKSNNDSINELIDVGLEYCLSYSTNMMDSKFSVIKEQTVQYLPPNTETK